VVDTPLTLICYRFSQRPNPKMLVPAVRTKELNMGAANWWASFPTSPPLDVEAGERFKQREGRILDAVFRASCEMAGIPPTPRQARKWNNGQGVALRHRNEAKSLL
jgi:hypothetical protein